MRSCHIHLLNGRKSERAAKIAASSASTVRIAMSIKRAMAHFVMLQCGNALPERKAWDTTRKIGCPAMLEACHAESSKSQGQSGIHTPERESKPQQQLRQAVPLPPHVQSWREVPSLHGLAGAQKGSRCIASNTHPLIPRVRPCRRGQTGSKA